MKWMNLSIKNLSYETKKPNFYSVIIELNF